MGLAITEVIANDAPSFIIDRYLVAETGQNPV